MKFFFTYLVLLLFPLMIIHRVNAQASTSDGNAQASTSNTNSGSKTSKSNDTSNIFTFVNAYNFDFSGHLQSNYLGHLNLFKIYKSGNQHIGFNVGIMKISYNSTNMDSVSNNPLNYHIDNVLIHPLDSGNIGSKYLRQQNKYAITRQNTVWSFYGEFLYQVNTSEENPIFLHLHAELLVNDWTGTDKITTIQQDTAIVTSKTTNLRQNIGNNIIYKQTFTNGYFGLGITCNLKLSNASKLFIQGTAGITTSTPAPYSTDINSYSSIVSNSYKTYEFYLVRASYQQSISSKLKIILGTDIRGLFPKYSPMYAAYLGAKLDISALQNLIK